ncbi:hypothetical protein [Streptosporangium sp. NPDC002607]
MTRRALLLVHTNAASPDQEADFNTWYDQVHVPQLLERVPGIVRATRFVASPEGPPTAEHHLAIYEIEADDPSAVLRAIDRAAAEGRLDFTPAMDTTRPPVMALYELAPSAGSTDHACGQAVRR